MKPRRKNQRPSDRASVRAQAMAARVRRIADAEAKASADRAAQAEADFQSQITTTRMQIYELADGEDATRVLAALAVVIGTPAEAGARTFGRDPAWVRQLHGALRIILDMCVLGGYRWRSDMADALDRAIEIAAQQPTHLPTEHFVPAYHEASGLALQILNHTVTAEAIA